MTRPMKAVFALGVLGFLYPYISIAHAMGKALARHMGDPLWCLALFGALVFMATLFYCQTRGLVELEKQFLNDQIEKEKYAESDDGYDDDWSI